MAAGRMATIWRVGAFATRDDLTIHAMRHAALRHLHADAGPGRRVTRVDHATFRRATGVLAHSRQHAPVACLVSETLALSSRPSTPGGSLCLCSRSVA